MCLSKLYKAVQLPKPEGLARSWGHSIDVYAPDTDDKHQRTALGIDRGNPLLVVGLNPSYADRDKSDHTITRIKEYAAWHGFGGFIMLNLSAQRTTRPEKLHSRRSPVLHRSNMEQFRKALDQYPDPHLLAVWGNNILLRPYLADTLAELMPLTSAWSATWLQIGRSGTRAGHPIHPSRGAYLPFYHFDAQHYYTTKFQTAAEQA